MRSLTARVLFAAGAVLVVFLGLTVAALDIAFRNAAERGIRDRLNIQVMALLTAADMDVTGNLRMQDDLPEPRFSNPGSGLYAQVMDEAGDAIWRSPSTVGVRLPAPAEMVTGARSFERTFIGDDEIFLLGFTVLWDDDEEGIEPQRFHFSVGESLQPYQAQVARFRANLLGWFGLLFAVLVGAQLLILRRTLRPLRELAEEVAGIEAGRHESVRKDYPRELQRLALNLNTLIRNERARLRRYHDSLADLAHSLKTPLSVIRGEVDGRDDTVARQVERMDDIVRYQLQRAATVGGPTFSAPIPVARPVRQVVESVRKAHTGRDIELDARVDERARFRGEPGDLMEITGNLLDNACKWARRQVRFQLERDGQALLIVVEDDGDGIDAAMREAVLERGNRADERVEGHGIGLAIVNEIVAQLGGTLVLDDSSLGGLRVTVHLPL